jgi:hypothetical protein
LPTFDNKDDQNAGLHLNGLREYFAPKNVPQKRHLPLALRSLWGEMTRDWALAVSDTFMTFEESEVHKDT